MTIIQPDLYYTRMLSSLGDKDRLIKNVSGHSVLEIGPGDGSILSHLAQAGYETYGIDATAESISRCRKNSPSSTVKLGLGDKAYEFFGENKFDNVICCSVLHEVYSYGASVAPKLTLGALVETIQSLRSTLVPGGRLLIRDGIAPQNKTEVSYLRFRESSQEEGFDLLQKYLKMIPFRGYGNREVNLKLTSESYVEGNNQSLMEFLYTYTWGEDSFPRETQELYGVFTLEEYVDFLNSLGFRVIKAKEYIQPGYITNLSPKVEIFDEKGERKNFFNSNCLIVAEKI